MDHSTSTSTPAHTDLAPSHQIKSQDDEHTLPPAAPAEIAHKKSPIDTQEQQVCSQPTNKSPWSRNNDNVAWDVGIVSLWSPESLLLLAPVPASDEEDRRYGATRCQASSLPTELPQDMMTCLSDLVSEPQPAILPLLAQVEQRCPIWRRSRCSTQQDALWASPIHLTATIWTL